MSIEHVRISRRGKDHLSVLKRKTQLDNWNVLCRWALCASLADPSQPTDIDIKLDSNVEIAWRVFAGGRPELYWALVKQRCKNEGLSLIEENVTKQFKLHLHRGLQYLAYNRKIENIADLLRRISTLI